MAFQQGCAPGQGMVFDLSLLNRVYNFAQVFPNYLTGINLSVLHVHKSNDYKVNLIYCNCQ